jgi:hypothetical protein
MWRFEEAGWYTHPTLGGICRENDGWYFWPFCQASKRVGPYKTLREAREAVERKEIR